MAESIGRTTRLQAVNGILRNIGERQVASLVDSTRGDVAASQQELDQQSREVQSEGWNFNTEEQTFTLQGDSRLLIPVNVMSVQVLSDPFDSAVMRGDYMYNRIDNTFAFDEDLEVLTIAQLSFNELPEQARYYIMIRASRVVAQSRVGDPTVVQFTAGDESYARYQLEARETEEAYYNVLDTPGLRALSNPRLR